MTEAPTFAELYQRLQSLPDYLRGEIIAGELVVSPRPAIPHANADGVAFAEINFRFHRKPGGVIFLAVGGSCLSPKSI